MTNSTNSIYGNSPVSSTSGGFSIDSVGSVMARSLAAAEARVTALTDQMHTNNQLITDGNAILNGVDAQGSSLTTEIASFSAGIPLGQLDKNSLIYQMVNTYNNLVPGAPNVTTPDMWGGSGTTVQGGTKINANLLGNQTTTPFTPAELDKKTLTVQHLRDIQTALAKKLSTSGNALTLQYFIANASQIFADSSDEIGSSTVNNVTLAQLRSTPYLPATIKLIDFYNANVIGNTNTVNVLGKYGPILENDVLSTSDLKNIQAAVIAYPLTASQSVYTAAQNILNDPNLNANIASVTSLITNVNLGALTSDSLTARMVNYYNTNLVGAGETNILGGIGQRTSEEVSKVLFTPEMLTNIKAAVKNYVDAYALLSGDTKNTTTQQTLDQEADAYFNYGGTNSQLLSQLSDLYKAMVPSSDRLMTSTGVSLDTLDQNSAIAQLVNFYNNTVYNNNPPVSPPPNNVLGSSGPISSSTVLSGNNLSSIQTAVTNYSNTINNAHFDIANLDQGKVTLSGLEPNSPIVLLVNYYNNNILNNVPGPNVLGQPHGTLISSTSGLTPDDLRRIILLANVYPPKNPSVSQSTLDEGALLLTGTDAYNKTLTTEINSLRDNNSYVFPYFLNSDPNSMDANALIARLVKFYNATVVGSGPNVLGGKGPVAVNAKLDATALTKMQKAVQDYVSSHSLKWILNNATDLAGDSINTEIANLTNNSTTFASSSTSITQLVSVYNSTVIANNINVLDKQGKIQPTDILTASALQKIKTILLANEPDFNSYTGLNVRKDFSGQTLTDEINKLKNNTLDIALYKNPAAVSFTQYQTMKAQLSFQLLTDRSVENTLNSVIDLEVKDSSGKTLQDEIDVLTSTGVTLTSLDPNSRLALMIKYYNANNAGTPITSITKDNAQNALKTLQNSALHLDFLVNETPLSGSNLSQELAGLSTGSIPWNSLDRDSLVYKLVSFYNDNNIGNKISATASVSQDQIKQIQAEIKSHIDSLSYISQQTYLDLQKEINNYNLFVSAWSQILKILGENIRSPLQAIG